jgi:hypothetical protein
MKGILTLLLGAGLAMFIGGCSDNAAKKPETLAEKPDLGEATKLPEKTAGSDTQSASVDAEKPAESAKKSGEPAASPGPILEAAKEEVAVKLEAKPSRIDDTLDDVDEEE